MPKGFIIDPKARSITEVTLGDHYEEINTAIGSRCFCVGCYLPEEDAVFVDDEGLLTDEPKDFFRVDPRVLGTNNPSPLCGRGVVLGADSEGNSVDAKVTLEKLTEAVRWGLPAGQAEPVAGFEFVSLDDPQSFIDALTKGGLR